LRLNRIIGGFVSFVMVFTGAIRVSVLEFGFLSLRQIQVTQMLNINILEVIVKGALLGRIIQFVRDMRSCRVLAAMRLVSSGAAIACITVLVL
jgi:hypothetical protein